MFKVKNKNTRTTSLTINDSKYHYMRLGKDTENAKFYSDGNAYVNCKEKKY